LTASASRAALGPEHAEIARAEEEHRMAKTTVVQVSDDLDGSANASEVRFGLKEPSTRSI
jgi:hypothetical protein